MGWMELLGQLGKGLSTAGQGLSAQGMPPAPQQGQAGGGQQEGASFLKELMKIFGGQQASTAGMSGRFDLLG